VPPSAPNGPPHIPPIAAPAAAYPICCRIPEKHV